MINQFTITETDGDASYCQYIVLWLKTNSLSQEEVCPVLLCYLIGRKEWIKICHLVLQLVLLVDMPRLCQIKCYLIILLVIWITWIFHVFNIIRYGRDKKSYIRHKAWWAYACWRYKEPAILISSLISMLDYWIKQISNLIGQCPIVASLDGRSLIGWTPLDPGRYARTWEFNNIATSWWALQYGRRQDWIS